MIRTLSRVALALTCSSAVVACFGSSGSSGSPAGAAPDDGATPGDDAASSAEAAAGLDGGTGLVDATVESGSGLDAMIEGGSDLDAAIDSAMSLEASAEASMPESGTAPVDAGVDVAVPVAGCIPDIPGGHYLFGDHYLRSDGELFYDPNGTATLVTKAGTGTALLGITSVVQQIDHACGLSSDTTVWCWPLSATGGNANGDLGNGTTGGTNPGRRGHRGRHQRPRRRAARVSHGRGADLHGLGHAVHVPDVRHPFGPHALVLGVLDGRDGRPRWAVLGDHGVDGEPRGRDADRGVGRRWRSAPIVLADRISVGFRHACIVSSGKVSCWGQNVAGNLGIGNSNLSFQPYPVSVMTGIGLPTTVDEVGSGFDFSCARSGGSVWCWGTNGDQQIGNPGVASSICNSNYCVPLPAPVQQSTADGGLTSTPDAGTDPSPLVNATSLYVGYQFACILDTAGTIWCWGATEAGVTFRPEAQPFTSTQVPYSSINELTIYGEDSNTGLRYVTESGQYVNGNRVFTPFCQ